jgi:hypothetical protein
MAQTGSPALFPAQYNFDESKTMAVLFVISVPNISMGIDNTTTEKRIRQKISC